MRVTNRINSGTNISNSNKVTLEKERPRFVMVTNISLLRSPGNVLKLYTADSLSDSP